jgi:uncharacterized protein (DUF2336 family)
MVGEAGLDIGVLTDVLEMGDAECRMVLARQLAGLLADPDASDLEKRQVVPVMLKLSVDQTESVRRVLAEELTTVSDLPPELLFAIIADKEDISLPFIATTMSLSTDHMFAILRVGDDARQATLAKRPDLTGDVAAYIIAHGTVGGCLALLANPILRFSADDLRILYKRHGSDGDLAEKLLAIATLPDDIRIAHLRRTASRMRQLVVESAWLPAHHAIDLVADAEDATALRILIEANQNELPETVAALAAKDLLTPSLVVRAASTGQIQVLAHLFAHLTGISLRKVAATMANAKPAAFQSLFKKSGLPKACHGIVLAAAQVNAELVEDQITLDSEAFGHRVLEALMTRYETFSDPDRDRQIEFLGRFGEGRVRRVARRIKLDMASAA